MLLCLPTATCLYFFPVRRNRACCRYSNRMLLGLKKTYSCLLVPIQGTTFRAMSPLVLYFPSRLRTKESLQKVLLVCNALHSGTSIGNSGRRSLSWPKRTRLWRRGFGALGATGRVAQIPAICHSPQHRTALLCTSSHSGRDMTSSLWALYNETKKQTEGELYSRHPACMLYNFKKPCI